MNETDRIAAITKYLEEVREQFASGHAVEHAYRPALKLLMSSFEDTVAINDPKHSEHGAPDFIFLKKSNNKIIKGHAEAKDITVSLDKVEKTDQMQRYSGYSNLFLTDYLEFRFFENGDKYETISLGYVKDGELVLTPENGVRLYDELAGFLERSPEKIRSGIRLAQIMGGKARRIRNNVKEYLTSDDIDSTELTKIYEMMKKLLVHDLEPKRFADMYAQTLVYGLFVARYGDDTPESFSRIEARDLVPKSNPFLRHFFDHIVGPDFDIRLGRIVDELCEIFSVSDVKDIVHKHLRIQDSTNDAKDPIIHFYEDFLQEYDPMERKRMGAYYTPIPIVKFIVRNVDRILREDFGIARGLASSDTFTKKVDIGQEVSVVKAGNVRASKTSVIDKEFHRVQVLDPAVGTATFLNETIKFIHEQFTGQEGRWSSYVADSLVPRLHGFELMMAPYTIAHLKLGMTLKETGVGSFQDRLGVYLTNTLEEGIPLQQDLFTFGLAQAVSEESRHAAEIKSDRPIMIVMGNPPYSGVSSNETAYANKLIEKYKVEPGGTQKLKEHKHWLNDDYVKFMAFAEEMVSKNGEGIVAMITNNGYLDNPTFRGMRWHLAKTFDKIYVLDLHGNAKKREVAPGGGKDENVFDIMQGVGIILAVKNGAKKGALADVYHGELYGKRTEKFQLLNEDRINWQKLPESSRLVDFLPRDLTGEGEYLEGVRLVDLMPVNTTGIVTAIDRLAVFYSKDELRETTERIFASDDPYGEFNIGDTRRATKEERLGELRKAVQNGPIRIAFRPFDTRWMYYTSRPEVWMNSPRSSVMKNLIDGSNISLVVARQSVGEWRYAFVADLIGDFNLTASAGRFGAGNYFPLYILHEDGSRTPNFAQEPLDKLMSKISNYSPEDVIDYIYASLYSPAYRLKYQEFLKSDFPYIPIADQSTFNRLVLLGRHLRTLHLMEHVDLEKFDTTFPEQGDNIVADVRYFAQEVGSDVAGVSHARRKANQRNAVYINESQYFGNVSKEVWEFYIGGYQPAQKWLKDRKGRKLSDNDIDHYQKMIKVLSETRRIMQEIDNQ